MIMLLAISGSLFLSLLLCYAYYRHQRALPLPPGPPGRFLFGNISDMPKTRPCITYSKWGQEYGPLTYCTVPGRAFLIINTYRAIADLLDKRGHIYSDRPRFVMYGELIGYNTGTAMLQIGPTWKKHRRLLRQALTSKIIKRDYAPLQARKMHQYMQTLLEKPENFLVNLKRPTGEGITEIAYGAHSSDGRDFIEMYKGLSRIAAKTLAGYAVDFIPSLKHLPAWFPGAKFKRDALRWGNQMRDCEDFMYQAAKRNFESGSPTRSYVSNLLSGEVKTGDPVLDEQVIKNSAFAFYRAGGDTTELLLKGILLALSLYPDVQTRLQADIDRVVGDRLPTIEDAPALPYIRAIIKEALRWCLPATTAVPHLVTEDDIYDGYFIPKGTVVMANSWGVSRDETIYPDPHTFNPERFMTNEKVLDPHEYAFGYGRRTCPGIELATQNAWITTASIFWAFEVRNKHPLKHADSANYFDLNFAGPRSETVEKRILEAVARGV